MVHAGILDGARAAFPTLLFLLASAPASAAQLSIARWEQFIDHAPEPDYLIQGGGACNTCAMIQSGVDSASGTFTANYDYPGFPPSQPPYSTYSRFSGLTGGTVSYGYISGFVAGSIETTEGRGDYYQMTFLGSFLDTLLISNPALTGQPGMLSGSVMVDFVPSTSVQASASDPSEQFASEVSWGLSGLGNASAQASGYQQATDNDPVYSFFAVNGGGSGSPMPTSVSVPVLVGFTFGDPFEFGLEFSASATGGGASSVDPLGSVWTAASALNFLNTVAWQGIISVTDEQGNPVSFDISAESAADWTVPAANPVPAPAGLWLLGTGLAALAARRRSRRVPEHLRI